MLYTLILCCEVNMWRIKVYMCLLRTKSTTVMANDITKETRGDFEELTKSGAL